MCWVLLPPLAKLVMIILVGKMTLHFLVSSFPGWRIMHFSQSWYQLHYVIVCGTLLNTDDYEMKRVFYFLFFILNISMDIRGSC